MNRNPIKRLGAGPEDSAEIKRHAFFTSINWEQTIAGQLPVPTPNIKKIVPIEVPFEKVYGKGAIDEALKDYNRLDQWSFVNK